MGRLKSDSFALTISNEGKTGIFPSAYLLYILYLFLKTKLEELESVIEVHDGKPFLVIFIVNSESLKCHDQTVLGHMIK